MSERECSDVKAWKSPKLKESSKEKWCVVWFVCETCDRGPLLCSCRVMWVVSVGRERGVCVQAPAPISPRSALALYNVLKTRAKAPKSPQNALFLPPNAPKSPIFAQKMPKSTKKLQNQLKKLQNQLKFCKIN